MWSNRYRWWWLGRVLIPDAGQAVRYRMLNEVQVAVASFIAYHPVLTK